MAAADREPGVNPWLASGLSMLAPGLGQAAAGRPWRGLVWFAASLTATVGTVAWIFSATRWRPVEGAAWYLAMLVTEFGSWIDAWLVAARGERDRPDPWLAALLSSLVPGLGQFLCGARARGAAFLAAALVLAGLTALAAIRSLPAGIAAGGHGLLPTLLALGLAWVVASIDAHRIARRRSPAREPRPEAAAALSVFLPGMGQFYLYGRRWWLAPFVLAACLAPAGVLLLVESVEPGMIPGWPRWLMNWPDGVLLAAGIAVSLGAVAQAWVAAARRAGLDPGWPRLPRIVWAAALAAWAVGLLPWQGWLKDRVRTFVIPSSSMEPTLLIDDRIWARRIASPQRGDIVVFMPPSRPAGETDEEMFVKRVIGLPGERLAVRHKRVFIDGHALDEPYAVHRDPGFQRGRDDFGPVVVPAGHLFLMGDNRDGSFDSRYFGPVAVDAVFGRVFKRFWPLSRAGLIPAPAPAN